MSSNLFAAEIGTVLRSVLADASGEAFLVNPDPATVDALVPVLRNLDDRPVVRLLADEEVLKEVVDDFLVSGRMADLGSEGYLSIRTVESVAGNSLLIAGPSVVALVIAGESVAGLATTDEEFVADARDRYERTWGDADEFTLRTPGLDRVREGLEEEFGRSVAEDFDAALASVDTVGRDGDPIDEVRLVLLLAARNEAMLYDVSRWGEDVGLASKATFSRTKIQLEEAGLLDTEKVPIDVGRPRLRLKTGEERLEAAEPEEMARVARDLLEN